MVVSRVARGRLRRCSWRGAPAWVAAVLAGGCPHSRADDLHLAVGLLSDKVVRGYSRSQGRATAEIDASLRWDSGWFVGAGVTDRRAGAPSGRFEWVASAGRGVALTPDWSAQVAVARYRHTGGRRAFDADYSDLSMSLDWRGRANLLLTASPDTRTGSRHGWTAALEAAWRQPLADRWALDAGIGRFDSSGIGRASYGYGSVGVSYRVGPVNVFASRVASHAVSSGAFSPSAQASKWVLAVVVVN